MSVDREHSTCQVQDIWFGGPQKVRARTLVHLYQFGRIFHHPSCDFVLNLLSTLSCTNYE